MKKLSLSIVVLISMMSVNASANSVFSLLDGNSLDGWSVVGGPAQFTINDGVVSGVTQGSRNTFLISDQTFTDFVLEFDIRMQGGPTVPNNSGVQIRSINDGGVVRGYQVDFDARDLEKNASIFEQGNGRLTTNDGTEFADLRNSYIPFDDGWNEVRVEVNGDTIQTFFNGNPGRTFVETRLPGSENSVYPVDGGSLALQLHGVGSIADADLQVQWRNIQVTVVPEPSGLLAFAGITAVALGRRRRHR